jgi:anti-anti-sigma regulatory factor
MITIKDKDELSIYDIEFIHEEFIKECKNDSFEIDLSKVNKIDISIIQLLISAYKSSMDNSKEFKILGVNQELRRVFKNSICEFLLGDIHE